ncbi:MAG TPA: hypothetical protein VNZ58_04075 [Thermomicrobiales bacterium]|nr:hypothetical protein [Thermomicrobiales bacterium]
MDDQEATYEIEHGHDAYTDDELLEQAQFNAQALLLAAVAALEGGVDATERWTQGVADVFLRGWDRDREWRAAEILDALLTNYRSFGAQVIEVDFDAAAPSAMVAELPDLELSEALGVPEEKADAIFRIGAHIASALGYVLEWHRSPDTGDVTLTVS